MSHKPSKAYYVEGVHRFWIDEGYVVCRIECSDYYARQAQNFCGGCKEMDFLLYHPERRDLWLVEVKDYRFDARPKVGELRVWRFRKLSGSCAISPLFTTSTTCTSCESL